MYSRLIVLHILLLSFFTGNYLKSQSMEIDLAKGLVAYYAFNQSELSSMVPGAPAVIPAGPQRVSNRFGDESSAWAFDGIKNHLRIPYSPVLDLDPSGQEGYTLSLWIKPRDDNQGCLLLKENDFGIRWSSMKSPLVVFDGFEGGFPEGHFRNWSSSEWYHIALVKDARQLQLYVNGALDKSWKTASKSPGGTKDIYLGQHPYFWGGFTGLIDDIAMYHRPLNQLEVIALSQIQNVPLESYAEVSEQKWTPGQFMGNWQGVITQPDNPLMPSYAFTLRFAEVEKGRLVGYSRIEVPEDKAFGVIRIQAIISGNTLNFEEIKVYRQKNYLGYKWCKKYGQLQYDQQNESLKGKWYASNCENVGELLLFRTQSQFNFHDNRLSERLSLEELVAKLEQSPEPLKEESLTLDFAPIEFSFGTAQLSPSSLDYLSREIVPLLQKYPKIQLSITGYTDSVGDDQVNLALSRGRAKSVHDYLISKGVERSRLRYEGLGEANPIAPNDTPTGRRVNRRVELTVSAT